MGASATSLLDPLIQLYMDNKCNLAFFFNEYKILIFGKLLWFNRTETLQDLYFGETINFIFDNLLVTACQVYTV